MSRFRRLLRWAVIAFIALFLIGAVGLGILYYVVSSKLPEVDSLRNVELQEPLYVYASDGRLIGLFGETRRYPVDIEKVPDRVRQAFIAAEDSNFDEPQRRRPQGHLAGPVADRHPQGRPRGGRQHHHPAGGTPVLPELGVQLHPQAG